jgi:hypothetical protein
VTRTLLRAVVVTLALAGVAAAQSPPPAPAQSPAPAPAQSAPSTPAERPAAAPGVTEEQVTNDIVNRASRDARFGGAVPGSLGVKPGWAAGYDLRWIDFNFAGGRKVRMHHITYTKDPSQRLTIFLDPDTNQWTSWERVPR